MGGLRRVRVLEPGPGHARPEGSASRCVRGFLGIDSLGWSTLAIVTEATEAERDAMVERLAAQLLEKFGAPDLAAARLAAEEEVAFAASLCDHPAQTLLAVQRSVENGEIRERFRTLRPREAAATPIGCTPMPAPLPSTKSKATMSRPNRSISWD